MPEETCSEGQKLGSQFSEDLVQDALVMSRFAFDRGLKVPSWVVPELDEVVTGGQKARSGSETPAARSGRMKKVSRIHAGLSELVAPATPASIRATECAGEFFKMFRRIPMMGAMTLAGLLSLGLYIATLLVGDSGGNDIYAIGTVQLRLLASAGLGASFYALFTANHYVITRTYNPNYSVTYWTRFFLGIIAGVIIANLLPGEGNTGSVLDRFGPSAIALLGGYSSDAVNKILRRLVEMLVTLVKGDAQEIVEASRKELKADFDARAKAQRLKTAVTLLRIQEQASLGSQEAKDALARLLEELLDQDSGGSQEQAPGAAADQPTG